MPPTNTAQQNMQQPDAVMEYGPMTKLVDLPEAHANGDPCVLSIDGKTYDLTKWVDFHPGGAIIRQYNGLDATHIFSTFHGDEGYEVLSKMIPVKEAGIPSKLDATLQAENAKLLSRFEQLEKELRADGFWKANVPWHIYKCVTTFLFMPIALYFQSLGWYITSAIFAGIFWQQLGWLGHDFCHHNTTPNRNVNNWAGMFWGNMLQGFSSAWWKDRHNSHHAVTNIVDHDPDIDNIPMLAWAPSDIDRCPEWARATLKYQAYYFLFLLPVLRITWMIQSIRFVIDMKASNFKFYREWYPIEAAGLVFHYVATAAILYQMPWKWAVVWFLISENLSGFGIAIVVFFNHYSVEKHDTSLAENFVKLQIMTTRNMNPGVVTDWICGGLNYQVEHHLFPTMPRHNLARCSLRIKQFCKENDLPYMCCGFSEGLGYVLEFLNEMGALADAQLQAKKKMKCGKVVGKKGKSKKVD